jgi:hypothetical protein
LAFPVGIVMSGTPQLRMFAFAKDCQRRQGYVQSINRFDGVITRLSLAVAATGH